LTAKPGITLAERKMTLAERGFEAGSLRTLWSPRRRLEQRRKKA
jgi:hypothetical protein